MQPTVHLHVPRACAQHRSLLLVHKQAWTCTDALGTRARNQSLEFIPAFSLTALNHLLRTKGSQQQHDRAGSVYTLPVNHRMSHEQVTHCETSQVALLAEIPAGTDHRRNTKAKGHDLSMAHGYLMTEVAKAYQPDSPWTHQPPPFWLKGRCEVFIVKKKSSNEQNTQVLLFLAASQDLVLYKRIIIKKSKFVAYMSGWHLFWTPVQFFNTDNYPHIQSSHRMS